jgi:hypothetical protein
MTSLRYLQNEREIADLKIPAPGSQPEFQFAAIVMSFLCSCAGRHPPDDLDLDYCYGKYIQLPADQPPADDSDDSSIGLSSIEGDQFDTENDSSWDGANICNLKL